MTEPDDQAKPRKPVVHYVDEKIIMRPTPYTLSIVQGVRRLLAAFGAVVPPLRRGRRRAYDHNAIADTAESLARDHVEETEAKFIEVVRDVCETHGVRVPRNTVLREICAPIYRAHRK